MVELGNASRNHYRATIREIQNNPRLTWDSVGGTWAFAYNRPNVTRIFEHYDKGKTPAETGMTSLSWVKSRFDKAAQYATGDNYHYGVFLLIQETWHPSLQASWGERPMSGWNIEGTLVLPNGDVLEALKPWYIRTKGAWNEAWWLSVRNNDNHWEVTVKEWSAHYGYTLLKAWHEYMHVLGKKSAMKGLCGFRETPSNFRNVVKNLYYPGKMFDYFIQNYDYQTTGIHPKTVSAVPDDILWLKVLRHEWGFKGKIAHYLSTCWSDKWGCPWNREAALEDFKQAAQYADIITVAPFATNSDWVIPDNDIKNHIKYPPLLVEWADLYLPMIPPAPDPEPQPEPSMNALWFWLGLGLAAMMISKKR